MIIDMCFPVASERVMYMKYIWYWEWKDEDWDKENEISAKFREALEKNPDDFPKMLTATCFTSRCKGFRIIEAKNENQLINLASIWWPTENWRFEAFLEMTPENNEQWQKYSSR